MKLKNFIIRFEYKDIGYPYLGYKVDSRSNINYQEILQYLRIKEWKIK